MSDDPKSYSFHAIGVGGYPINGDVWDLPVGTPVSVGGKVKSSHAAVDALAYITGVDYGVSSGDFSVHAVHQADHHTSKSLENILFEVMKKAQVAKTPPVIAIGKKGGKIIGYGPHHKPIYLDETKPQTHPQDSYADLPVAVKTFLEVIGNNEWNKKDTKVVPHGTKAGVWSISLSSKWHLPSNFVLKMASKDANVKVAKNQVKTKNGWTKIFIKELNPAAHVHAKKHTEPVAPAPIPDEATITVAPEEELPWAYKKTPALKTTSPVLPGPGGSVYAHLPKAMLNNTPHKWQVAWHGPSGSVMTKPVQVTKWAQGGKFAPKGLPKSLSWPGEWDAMAASGELDIQVAANGQSFTVVMGKDSFVFMPAGVKKHHAATIATMSAWETHALPIKSATKGDNFETMPEPEVKAPLPSPPKAKPEPVAASFDVLAELGGANGAKHLVSNTGEHVVWKPSDKYTGPAETGASDVASYITGGLVPIATEMYYKGKKGLVQPMTTLGKNSGSQFDPTKLNSKQAAQLFTHMISDWVVSNYDAHSGNFGLDGDGNIIGIDKGQAYKFLNVTDPYSLKSKASGQLTEPDSFDEYFATQWAPIPPDKTVYPKFVQALKSGKVQIDPNDPIIKAAIAKCSKMQTHQLKGLKAYGDVAFGQSGGAKLILVVKKRCTNLKGGVDKLWGKLGIDTNINVDPTQHTVITKPAALPTVVKIHDQFYDPNKPSNSNHLNDTRDGWLNGTVEIGSKEWKIIGRKRTTKGQMYGDTSTSEKWLIRSGKTTKFVSAADIFAAGVSKFEGNPLYGDLPEGAVVVKADAQTKKLMNEILGGTHKNGKTYQDIIDLYQSNGVGVAVAGGILRDVLQGKKGKDVDVIVTCSAHTSAKIGLSSKGWVSNLQYSKGYGSQPTGQRFIPVQSLFKVYDNDEGMDIASMRGVNYNASNYATYGGSSTNQNNQDAKKAVESASFTDDSINRDFACNAIFYDTENDAIIDVSGRGIADSKNKVLHPPTEDLKAWGDNNGPRNFARAFKFIGRGYSMTPELIKFMGDNWDHYKSSSDYSEGWSNQWSNITTYGMAPKAAKWTQAERTKQWNNIVSFLDKNFAGQSGIRSYVKSQYSFLQP